MPFDLRGIKLSTNFWIDGGEYHVVDNHLSFIRGTDPARCWCQWAYDSQRLCKNILFHDSYMSLGVLGKLTDIQK